MVGFIGIAGKSPFGAYIYIFFFTTINQGSIKIELYKEKP